MDGGLKFLGGCTFCKTRRKDSEKGFYNAGSVNYNPPGFDGTEDFLEGFAGSRFGLRKSFGVQFS